MVYSVNRRGKKYSLMQSKNTNQAAGAEMRHFLTFAKGSSELKRYAGEQCNEFAQVRAVLNFLRQALDLGKLRKPFLVAIPPL